jgi:hypothetical protein
MNPGCTNSIRNQGLAPGPKAAREWPLVNGIKRMGASLWSVCPVLPLRDAANRIVFLGFSYAAVLAATAVLLHLSRITKARFLVG